ncbi:metalloregulator ArsR/SmtB family transcription factor [Isoptericola sp. b441]|uniref:Metalloregulator ArsR/SmtB family transcription factor n=1 Tax=Actinotalea lenta TaxID=3064654 RepID=A0ABT9DDI1_9CELL|nr:MULTISPECIES: metalloregulator ArsR/SmtB family transcription factor [unclassified Isoptericola]MDO8108444.1 metalloregulator ArsR/SmtB family transcription factor [Isoptericola sp. b441]MDO8119863.1 metalloregulator ArsR/SmtB family transcription factor [Isoptericola sp. b490]
MVTKLPLDVAAAGEACCAPLVTETITAEQAEVLAARIKALADPARLRLVSLLAASPGGEACQCDLTEPLGLSQPTVSHHLKVLYQAGLVAKEKRSTWVYYSVVPEALATIADVLTPGR